MARCHVLTGEHSHLRRWMLYFFARYVELSLLAWSYRLLRGRHQRLGRNRLARAALGWGFAAPFGYLGDTARPSPTPEVLRMLDALDGPIAVGPCRCRSAHGSCDHPLETDIVIRTGVEAWTRAFPHQYRLIGKEEAKGIASECSQLGMWHMVFIHCPVNQDNEYVICNCCTCGCVPYILNRELGQRIYPLLHGEFMARIDLERCTGHGACAAACPFGARTLENGQVRIVGICFGCGRCAAACPEQAIEMVRRRMQHTIRNTQHLT
jgi:ferredoxin